MSQGLVPRNLKRVKSDSPQFPPLLAAGIFINIKNLLRNPEEVLKLFIF